MAFPGAAALWGDIGVRKKVLRSSIDRCKWALTRRIEFTEISNPEKLERAFALTLALKVLAQHAD